MATAFKCDRCNGVFLYESNDFIIKESKDKEGYSTFYHTVIREIEPLTYNLCNDCCEKFFVSVGDGKEQVKERTRRMVKAALEQEKKER